VTGNPNFKEKPIFDIECFRNVALPMAVYKYVYDYDYDYD